jgi:DNA-binding beta-propeller fold protein YncE
MLPALGHFARFTSGSAEKAVKRVQHDITKCFLLLLIMFLPLPALAVKFPDNVKTYVNGVFPNTNFRFDGVVILPDNTVYLPLFPAKVITPETLTIKQTLPTGKPLQAKPDVVIFNNDFVLLKVIVDGHGQRTVFYMPNPPIEVKSGLLPQDMLVPKGLVLPENLKAVIGNLEIGRALDPTIKTAGAGRSAVTPAVGFNAPANIAQLKDKTFYVATSYNKNIQVINQGAKTPEYALEQRSIPINIRAWDDRFLLVTSYDKRSLDVISLQDDRIIKQIDFKTQPDEIVIDAKNKIAYVSSAGDSSIYAVNLETMTLLRQIKISGMCEKLSLSHDGAKLFYYDKKTRDIWAVELNNGYLLRDIGKFPNVSKIVYSNGKIYIASRTKDRLAIIDYDTIKLVAEIPVFEKPVDMTVFDGNLFILSASQNAVQVLNTATDTITDDIYLNTGGFSTKIYPVENTEIAIVTDTLSAVYTVVNLKTKQVLKANPLEVPVSSIVVTKRMQKIN